MQNNIVKLGDITLNYNYWDCECEDNYIHSNDEDTCNKCNAEKEEQPNSRQCEVEYYLTLKTN